MPKKAPAHSVFLNTIRKELDRIEELSNFVVETSKNLTSDHERNTSLKYYQSLTIAYKKTFASIETAVKLLPRNADKDRKFMACDDFEQLFIEEGGWEFYEGFRSFHQGIDYYYNPETKDACLLLDMYLHACVSNRPHYHEVFVHYPAHFLDKVERVLFIGGGDSMVLHEVLKYNEQLELVVGLELDQQVVRSTFSRMGTQPHFDKHDKVEWWFGDAAQALNVLPTDYYGTFDLVIVDILSIVADNLKVNDEMTIMEAALLLMKPDGIIVKNEDEGYVPGNTNSSKFTKHTVDIMYYDVPIYCLQTFVIGSNTIDFSKKTKPVDHKVSTMYLKDVNEFQSQFDTWYTSSGSNIVEEDDDYCQEETLTIESSSSSSGEQNSMVPSSSDKSPPLGMTMIIDAEKIPIHLLEEFSSGIQKTISECLTTKIGFTEVTKLDQELQGVGYTLTFVFEEGCVTARCFREKHYCAIDVQLWKHVHKTELVRKELLAAIGCEESSSVYRIVTSGILGVEENDKNNKIGPPQPPKTNPPRSDNTESESCTSRQSKDSAAATKSTFSKRKDPTIEFHNATVDSYFSSAALEQYLSQDPLGEQTIVRYKLRDWDKNTKKDMSKLLTTSLFNALSAASEEWERNDIDQIQVKENDIGEGLVIVASWSEGNIVLVWDGEHRVDVNLFSLNDSCEPTHGIINKAFQWLFRRPTVKDDFPRGTGLIVNFSDEIPPREWGEERDKPFWAPGWQP